ncbi:hypothetical protein [Xylocopilactobacillus apicola]|uniref:hypothetical protein n=1 Tax=Xylocopilactobacillus apicola TaxID=2932184 RepID=UPI0029536F9F|nr:hypothetical protein [Xylocopilactobacillus apicola]
MNRKFMIFILSFCSLGCSFTSVDAFSEEQNHQISVFQSEYRNLDRTRYNYKNIYSQKPIFSISPVIGADTNSYLRSYDQTYNFVRSLFGLSGIPQNEFDNQKALIGSYDMASVPKKDGSNIQHGLEGVVKPPYLDNYVWKQGADATRAGNIANIVPTGFSNYSEQTVWDDVLGFVVDNNNYDVNSVGHRDWMLSQALKSYGVGTIYTDVSDPNTVVSNGNENLALGYQVFYWGGGYDGDYNSNLIEPLTYPAPNLFPIELMNSSNPLKPVCWSVGFSKASVVDKNNKPTITIKNLKTGQESSVDHKNIFYESQYGGYETVYSFIPRGIELKTDEIYQINFTNLNLKTAENESINNYSYQVSFFSLNSKQNEDDYSNAGRSVYVNYQPNYGVRIYQEPGGKPTDTFAFHGTSWLIIQQKQDEHGRVWTQIGTNQWIPNDYLVTVSYDQTPVGKVKYVPGYGINLWQGYANNKIFTGRRVMDGTKWKVFKKAIVGDTYWFNLGGNLWVDGQYMTIEA